mgnify:CR=1 FL=1
MNLPSSYRQCRALPLSYLFQEGHQKWCPVSFWPIFVHTLPDSLDSVINTAQIPHSPVLQMTERLQLLCVRPLALMNFDNKVFYHTLSFCTFA